MRSTRGFTLIEIIVAVALVAILSAAIAPSVLNNIAMGRRSRAQSDVQAIASAVMRFKADTGKYPRVIMGSAKDHPDSIFSYLASLNGDFPSHSSPPTGWPTAFTQSPTTTQGATEDITHHLILGSSRWSGSGDSLYTRADPLEDPQAVGFRGQLLSADPADPWGNKYMVNVRALGMPGRAVWVISAGPNMVIETSFEDTLAADVIENDDIGYRIQ